MKKIGVEPWAHSYVIVSKGSKKTLYYVDEEEEEIMKVAKKEWIRLTISGPNSPTVNLRASEFKIETFGKC